MPRSFRAAVIEWVRVAADPSTPSSVRCGACSACCRSQGEVAVSEADLAANPALRVTGAWRETQAGPVTALERSADGACVHLVDGRCTQYAGRPAVCRRFDCRETAAWQIDMPNEPEITAAGCERALADFERPSIGAEQVAYRSGFNAAQAMIATGGSAGNAAFEATLTAARTLAALGDDPARDALADFAWRRHHVPREKLLRSIDKQRRQVARARPGGSTR